MPRPPLTERAKLYLRRFPDLRRHPSDPQNSHNVFFEAALAIVKGFCLVDGEAFDVLADYASRSDQPWSEREIWHKIRTASATDVPSGYLRDDDGEDSGTGSTPKRTAPAPAPKPEFDLATLERCAGHFAREVDLIWLANRSHVDPALVTPAKFLASLYKPGEKVLVFTNDRTQGQCLYPGEEIPTTGPRGVWYLCQPVDGKEHPNPRSLDKEGNPKASRRSEESVTDWRFLVLESDEAPLRFWLGALVQLPLRIAAVYTSGKRSVHALVRVDAKTKAEWDTAKHAMKTGLIILGACEGALSAVRLTRLPGCYREGHDVPGGGGKRYERFPQSQLQKLLYLNPAAPLRPLCEMLAVRDIERDWLRLAANGVADSDATGGAWIRNGLAYYATVNRNIRDALATFGTEVEA